MANFLSSLLNPGAAYKHAMRPINQGFSQAQGYETPYIQQGQEQYAPLNEARTNLLNPIQLENQWTQAYQTSPYAKQLLGENQEAGLEAASQMGLMGSSAALNNIQQGAGNIVAKDRQQFLEDLMNKYLAGIGLGQSLYGTGAAMAGTLGGQAIGRGENLANLKYGEYAAPGEQLMRLLGLGTQAYGYSQLPDLYSPKPAVQANPLLS